MICQTLLGIVPGAATVAGARLEWRGRDLLQTERDGLARHTRRRDRNDLSGPDRGAQSPDHRRAPDHRRDPRPPGLHAREARTRTIEVLGMAGFPEPEHRMKSYPAELSGGLRQRVAIALALACRPALMIADEATTNLDVSIQAQIVKLLRRLRRSWAWR